MNNNFPYFYNNQLRKLIEQFQRALSQFKIKDGNAYRPVTVMFAEASRQALFNAMNGASENTISSLPKLAYHWSGARIDFSRLNNSKEVKVDFVTEKKFNKETGKYENEVGNQYNIERLASIPLELDFSVTGFTSSYDQKLEILEQMIMAFTPSLSLQTSENVFDWGGLSDIILSPEITPSNKSVPQGMEDDVHSFSISFVAKGWISPPSKVSKVNIVKSIIMDLEDETHHVSRELFSTKNFKLKIVENDLGQLISPNDESPSWRTILDEYGGISNSSKLILNYGDNIESESTLLVANIFYTDDDEKLFISFDTDTLPTPSITNVSIINPNDNNLPTPVNGMKFLLTNDIGNSVYWGNVSAKENDIVEYNDGSWQVIFDSNIQNTDNRFFISTNETDNILRLCFHKGIWFDVINDTFEVGYFRFLL